MKVQLCLYKELGKTHKYAEAIAVIPSFTVRHYCTLADIHNTVSWGNGRWGGGGETHVGVVTHDILVPKGVQPTFLTLTVRQKM